MPFARIACSSIISDSTKQKLLISITAILGESLNKSKQYVMVDVVDKASCMFGGEDKPCAIVEISCIGELTSSINNDISRKITLLLEQELSIECTRIFITFTEFQRSHWGYNGKTFG